MTPARIPPVAESVEQVDRQSTASLEPNGRERDQILRGKRDHTPTVQAFARHRLSAYEAGRAEGVRAASRACTIYQEWCKGWGLVKNENVAAEAANECAEMLTVLPRTLPDDDEQAGALISNAIRALSKEPTK